MPKLIIDGRHIEVAPGVKVIAAAEQAGIMIPRFCYHPALGSVGACRLCAVQFVDGPVHGLQMSCMVEAKDGMVVSTSDEEAVDFRRFVIELLMLNHPHDCPVCDEGGQCLLQDETISGGHAMRRFMGKKRTHRDQYLGELVQHEMNRCIQCYRCRRFYQDYCGYRDFGVMGSAGRVYFGRYADGALENPFSGNLIDICPTGVLTDKPSRFKGRRWDFQRTPSLCTRCSLGCSITVSARYREIIRIEARFNEDINGHFICNRGRYGFAFANHPDRPRQALINGMPASIEEAIRSAADRLAAVARSFGTDAIACVSSCRASVETHMSLKFLADAMGLQQPGCFIDRALQENVTAAVGRLTPELAVSLRSVEKADALLVIGVDPIQESPMLALAMRQAQRAGARIVVLDSRPVTLPCEFDHLQLPPDEITSVLQNSDEPIKGLFQHSQKPVIVCGSNVVTAPIIHAAADLANVLSTESRHPGMFFVLSGANAYSAALSFPDGLSFEEILSQIESGKIKALMLAESDFLPEFPDHERVENAVKQLDLLVILDYMPTPSVVFAGQSPTDMNDPMPFTFVIPTLTHFETPASFINQEGRLQQAAPVHANGLPLSQLTGGNHPPREFRRDIPGAGAKAAWEILSEMLAAVSSAPSIPASFEDFWRQIRSELSECCKIEKQEGLDRG